MEQLLHLLIVDLDRGIALTGQVGRRWLFPVLPSAERERPGILVQRWLEARGVQGAIVGQWLGRGRPDGRSIDWLVVVDLPAGDRLTRDGSLSWSPLSGLSRSAALIDYQGWAIARCTKHAQIPSIDGPFGSPWWLHSVRAWVEGKMGQPIDSAAVSYRTSAYEVVLGFRASTRAAYFKGLAADRAIEARITHGLHLAAPQSFAPTIALEERPDGTTWWLAGACDGRALTNCTKSIEEAAAGLGSLQRRLTLARGVQTQLPAANVGGAMTWAARWLAEQAVHGEAPAAGLRRRCEVVQSSGWPEGWVSIDLDPGNVLLGNGGVRFVDLDGSCHGPAPLAVATLVRRMRKAMGHDPCRDRLAYSAFERGWGSAAPRETDWAAFDAVSALLDAHMSWQRVVRNVARGEVWDVNSIAKARILRHLRRICTDGQDAPAIRCEGRSSPRRPAGPSALALEAEPPKGVR